MSAISSFVSSIFLNIYITYTYNILYKSGEIKNKLREAKVFCCPEIRADRRPSPFWPIWPKHVSKVTAVKFDIHVLAVNIRPIRISTSFRSQLYFAKQKFWFALDWRFARFYAYILHPLGSDVFPVSVRAPLYGFRRQLYYTDVKVERKSLPPFVDKGKFLP